MEKVTIETYNLMSQEYDEETSDFWDRFPEQILEEFTNNVSGKILDIGSGPGRDALLLQKSGHQVVCLDASKAMIEITRQKGLESLVADLLNIPLPNQSFGGVWAYTSLIHIKKSELPQGLAEIHRVLKSGGIFGLGVIEGEGEGYKESSAIHLPRWFAYYQEKEIREHLRAAGFEVFFYKNFQPNSKRYLNFVSRKIG